MNILKSGGTLSLAYEVRMGRAIGPPTGQLFGGFKLLIKVR